MESELDGQLPLFEPYTERVTTGAHEASRPLNRWVVVDWDTWKDHDYETEDSQG